MSDRIKRTIALLTMLLFTISLFIYVVHKVYNDTMKHKQEQRAKTEQIYGNDVGTKTVRASDGKDYNVITIKLDGKTFTCFRSGLEYRNTHMGCVKDD